MKISRRILVFLMALVLCMGGLPHTAVSYDLEKKVRCYKLSNGIKVLLLERHLSPTVSLYIRHLSGAIDDPEGKTGMAHFLEHMMFKGTKTIGTKDYAKEIVILKNIRKTGRALDLERMKGLKANPKNIQTLSGRLAELQKEHSQIIISNEIDRLYTENGGLDMNASTGQDVTTFHVSLPANKIELWARIEADRMMNPVLREFYTERDVIIEERRQRVESNPDGKLFEQFFAAAFSKHPYRRPILGWSQDMPFLDIEVMEAFLKRAYAPEKTVITVVGDINAKSTFLLIKKYFGNIPRQNITPSAIPEEPAQKTARRVEIIFDSSSRIVMGYHKPTLPAYDDYVFDVIDALLGKGRTSRLYRKLVQEKGIAQTIYTTSATPGSRYPNLFMIYATPRHPYTVQQLEASIFEEVARLKTQPVSEKEMRKIKNQLKADFIRGLETNSGLAGNLSYYEILAGDYRYLTRHSTMVEKITPQDVMRVASKYLIYTNRTVAILKRPPQEKAATAKETIP